MFIFWKNNIMTYGSIYDYFIYFLIQFQNFSSLIFQMSIQYQVDIKYLNNSSKKRGAINILYKKMFV